MIQEKEITKVGDNNPIKVNVRIIAAGNESFKDLVKNKLFRRDLYERFIDKITIPTLQERKEDMDFFIDKFIDEKSNELGKKRVYIDNEAKNLLKDYRWEGNVRQLMNFIQKLVTHVKQDENTKTYIIRPDLVIKYYLTEIKTYEDEPIYNDYTWKTAYYIARKNAIERALIRCNENVEKTIELLGITRSTYYKWKNEK